MMRARASISSKSLARDDKWPSFVLNDQESNKAKGRVQGFEAWYRLASSQMYHEGVDQGQDPRQFPSSFLHVHDHVPVPSVQVQDGRIDFRGTVPFTHTVFTKKNEGFGAILGRY